MAGVVDPVTGEEINAVNQILLDNGFVSERNWTTQKFTGAAHDEKSWAKRLHVPLKFAFGKQKLGNFWS